MPARATAPAAAPAASAGVQAQFREPAKVEVKVTTVQPGAGSSKRKKPPPLASMPKLVNMQLLSHQSCEVNLAHIWHHTCIQWQCVTPSFEALATRPLHTLRLAHNCVEEEHTSYAVATENQAFVLVCCTKSLTHSFSVDSMLGHNTRHRAGCRAHPCRRPCRFDEHT
jgi:hypothetical protein